MPCSNEPEPTVSNTDNNCQNPFLSAQPKKCQVEIQINDTEPICEDHEIETYFRRLIQFTRLSGLFFSPKGSRLQWFLNSFINVIVIIAVSSLIVFEIQVVAADGIDIDLEMSTMLCGLVWHAQSMISMAFLIWWQVHGDLWKYILSVMSTQKGECIANGTGILKRSLYLFRILNIIFIGIVLIYHYGPNPFGQGAKYNFFGKPLLKPLQSYCIIHLFACWNLSIFLFNILIDGTYLEMRHFNATVSKLEGTDEYALKNELLWLISRHSQIVNTIHALDKLFRVYAFTMVATIIPSTLLSLIMLAHRVDDYIDLVILGLPSLGITFYGFLGLTLAPARLYEEMYRAKNVLCLNTKIWHPYRTDVYQLAMALSSHLDQPNMGLTIWGFAVLSKPLILATFSGMIMMLSLVLEIVPTIEEIVEENEEENMLLNMTMGVIAL